jgi:hypothetical protein
MASPIAPTTLPGMKKKNHALAFVDKKDASVIARIWSVTFICSTFSHSGG